jgi:hypothetical protein
VSQSDQVLAMSFDGGDVFDHDDGEEEDEDDWVMPGDPKNRTPPR